MGRLNYDEVRLYLREYNLGPDNPSHYDFNGLVHLLLAALDNLRERALPAELEDICYSMTDDQRQFLHQLAIHATRLNDEATKLQDE